MAKKRIKDLTEALAIVLADNYLEADNGGVAGSNKVKASELTKVLSDGTSVALQAEGESVKTPHIQSGGLRVTANVLTVQKYSGGSGTFEDPYLISSAADLAQMSNTPSDWSSSFLQVGNIRLSGTYRNNIGTADLPFLGTYDGGFYTVKGLRISQTDIFEFRGLFSYVGGAASITKVGIVDSLCEVGSYTKKIGMLIGKLIDTATVTYCYVYTTFTSTGSGSGAGDTGVAPLVSDLAGGNVSQCYTHVLVETGADVSIPPANIVWEVSGGTITDCYANGVDNAPSSSSSSRGIQVHTSGTMRNILSAVQNGGGAAASGGATASGLYHMESAEATAAISTPLSVSKLDNTSYFPEFDFTDVWKVLAYRIALRNNEGNQGVPLDAVQITTLVGGTAYLADGSALFLPRTRLSITTGASPTITTEGVSVGVTISTTVDGLRLSVLSSSSSSINNYQIIQPISTTSLKVDIFLHEGSNATEFYIKSAAGADLTTTVYNFQILVSKK